MLRKYADAASVTTALLPATANVLPTARAVLPADGICATVVLSAGPSIPAGDDNGAGRYQSHIVLLGTGQHMQCQFVCRSMYRMYATSVDTDNVVSIAISLRRGDQLGATHEFSTGDSLSPVVLHGTGADHTAVLWHEHGCPANRNSPAASDDGCPIGTLRTAADGYSAIEFARQSFHAANH
jgi:hypothetical protein